MSFSVSSLGDKALGFLGRFGGEREIAFSVKVIGGFHAGATRFFEGGALRVGASPQGDIVLADEDVQDEHFEVIVGANLAGPYADVITLDGDVTISPGQYLAAQSNRRVKLPVVITLGDAAIKIEPVEQKSKRSFLLASVVAGAVALFLAFPYLLPKNNPILSNGSNPMASYPPSSVATGEEKNDFSTGTPSAVVTGATAERFAPTHQIVEDLKNRLALFGLQQDIKLRPNGEQVIVSGVLSSEKLAAWHTLKNEWIKVNGRQAFLIDAVRAQPTVQNNDLLAAVVFDDPAYIIIQSGARVKVGESVGNGWVLTNISREDVTLRRGSDERRIRY